MATGIMIIGPSGSGKTTLGKLVADELGYPYFDVDDYIWRKDTEEPYTVMYSREEKIEGLKTAVSPPSFASLREIFSRPTAHLVSAQSRSGGHVMTFGGENDDFWG